MTSPFSEKYPLLGRVLDEQARFLKSLDVTLPDLVATVQKNAFGLIDELSTSDDVQKEAIMIVVVLANTPPLFYREVEKISPAPVRDIIAQLRAANPRDALTPPLAQAKTALGIAMMQALQAQIESNAGTVTTDQADVIRKRMLNQAVHEENRTFASLDCPGLRQRYDARKDELLALVTRLAQPAKPPAPPQGPVF